VSKWDGTLRTVFYLRRVHQWSACTCAHDCRIHNEGMKTIIKLYVGLYSQYWSLWFQPGNLATTRAGTRYTVFLCVRLSFQCRCWIIRINPLNTELNSICHLLILLGDLTFMGRCIVSISYKMQRYTVHLYLETALHVSGGTSTHHHQERIQLYLQHLVFVTPLLLHDAIVEELELVWVCCGWRTPPTAHSNLFQIFHDSVR
jgi:hypothetical protein